MAGTQPVNPRIGFVGIGLMGSPMAGRLLEAGYSLTVFNRTREKAETVLNKGAIWAETPAEVARASDVVITMVLDGAAFRSVTLGETGAIAGLRPGALLIDMSTVSPADSAIVGEACDRAGMDYLRAPVTGSTVLAASGALGTLASGPKHRYEEALPIFQVFGPRQFYLGPGDESRALKLALNMLIGITMVGLSEGLLLAEKSGLDWRQVLEIYCNSAVGSPFVNYKAPSLAERDFDPAFTARGICKDLDLAIEAARGVGAASPLTVLTRQLFQATVDSGWGERDFSAVLMYLEKTSGLEPVDSTAG